MNEGIPQNVAFNFRLRFLTVTLPISFPSSKGFGSFSFIITITQLTDSFPRSSRVPSQRTSRSQISAEAHVQIIEEPIGAVEVKVLTSQSRRTSLVECDT